MNTSGKHSDRSSMDEQQFRKILVQIRALAKSQNDSISKEQVRNKFLPLNVDEGHFLLIYKYLTEENVTLYDTEDERLLASDNASKSLEPPKSLFRDTEDNEYLKMYIKELNSLNIPDKEERQGIIEEILNDKSSAAYRLPNLYLKEVVDVARLYAGQGVALEDLVGEGNVGVLTGISMLDCCETAEEVDEFIMKMIMDSMESLITENFTDAEFDLKVVDRVNELSDKAKELAEEAERLMTAEELAAELEQDVEYIRETIRLSGNAIPYIQGCIENPEI